MAERRHAERLRELFRQLEVKHMGASLGVIASSFGLASYPEHEKDLDEIERAADAALYRAKEQGRDRVAVA
jgi:diguanylate cyclase (GGDEF)-like protein